MSRSSLPTRARRALRATGIISSAALVGSAAVLLSGAGPAQAATPTPASPQTQLSGLHDSLVASVVAPNGDQNPYGMAIVPLSSGSLIKGNVLVADFNNAAGLAAGGTTIMQVDPSTGASSVFYSGAPVHRWRVRWALPSTRSMTGCGSAPTARPRTEPEPTTY